MKLTKFKTTRRGKYTRLVASVADQSGAQDYELRIAGPASAVKRVFAKSDFSVSIDPKRGAKDAEKEFAKYSQAQAQQFAELAQLENTSELDLFKRPAADPDPEKSVFVSLQRVRGEGTFWTLAFPYYLPTGWNIFVYPPLPVGYVTATVSPSTGDQDIFLNGVFGSLGSSTKGGTLPDTVFSVAPPFGWARIQIFGWTAGSGNFSALTV